MKPSKVRTPTIYDVAELSGVSISTVSRVLNSSGRVNEATRQKVLTAIDQLDFIPKAEARARALKSTGRIGAITPFFTAPSFVQRLRGVAGALADSNYELVIYTVDSQERLSGYMATLPLTRGLDGLLVISLAVDPEDILRLLAHGLETVFIEFHSQKISSVEIDDYEGGRLAARCLLNKGHRRMAFLGDLDPPDYAIQPIGHRLRGFQSVLAEQGIPLPPDYIRSSPYIREDTIQAASQLLSLSERPTAIFAASDMQAIATIKVAGEMGLNIPRDLAVLGFDDIDMADYLGLTTIRQHLEDSGSIAAEMLLNRMVDTSRQVQHITLPLSLVERETV
jgi:LacI family transcriptional regulator